MTDSVKIYTGEKKTEQPPKSTEVDATLQAQRDAIDDKVAQMPKEHGGRPKDKGLEPTRYGDWELKGRCVDF